MESALTDQRPTRVRWQILAILSLIMVVTAFGRLNLGIAGKSIQEEFHLSSQAMGWIFGAFAFGYALFQVPSGWAADRFGPRKAPTLAILWWATLTMVMNLVPYFALRLSWGAQSYYREAGKCMGLVFCDVSVPVVQRGCMTGPKAALIALYFGVREVYR